MSDSIRKVDKAMASINKGVDKKEEMKTMMAPYANWDRFLVPAPLSIALLGQLILVSADTDFSLQDKNNPINFKLLKYPDSFRTCLVQVSNKGWGAFNLAHTNMDQIRLHSSNVDGHVRTAVKFLISGSPEEVALMLPDALKSIETIAEECVALSRSVQEEFVAEMQLVAELLEACTRARGKYEQNLKDTKTSIEVANEYKKSIETQKELAEKKQKEMVKQMKNAENDYKDALDSMPSTGDLIGLSVAGAIIDVARTFTGFLSTAKEKLTPMGASRASAEKPSGSSSTDLNESVTMRSFKLVSQIKVQTEALERLACGKKNKQGEMEPDWNKIGMKNGAQYVKRQLETIVEKKFPGRESEIREKVKQLCIDGVEICETLLVLQKALSKNGGEIKDVVDHAQELSSRVASMDVASRAFLGGNSISSNPPQLSKQVQANQQASGDDGLVKSALQNARFKTETAKEMLKDSRNQYDKSCEDLTQRMKEYGDILADLAKYDLQKIDFETIRGVLINGIKALGELQEQWGKLVQFFAMLSNLVKCCFAQSLQTFIKTSCNQKKLTEAGLAMSNTMRDVIYEQAFQANQIAFVVKSISSAYVEVSGAHLMDRVTCLGKLLAVDPANRHEITQKREELNQGCKDAQKAIERIAREKKKEIDEAFEKRIGRIETEVEALMPPMSKAEVKEIQDEVQTGMAISKAAIEEEMNDWC